MTHYLLYAHGGAYNHGSEASVKCDIEFLRRISPDCRITLSSHFPDQDKEFEIDADEIIGRNMDGKTNEEIYAETINCITPDTICLSVGGDNYCYPNWQRYATVHYAAIKRGAKSILWSCSLEPSMIDNEMLEVLRTHHLIAVRESLTYDALKECGLTNVVQTADIAFLLKSQPTALPKGNYVVINLSPLVIRKNPNVLKAFQQLVNQILDDTDLNIAFIPHVEVSVDNDYEALSMLEGDENRIFRIPTGLSAAQYKYIIGNADFCVAARTHVTIAAWSSFVPTIAVGYSTKARGIAKDLGQSEYVVDAYELNGEKLCEMFFTLFKNCKNVKSLLKIKVKNCQNTLKTVIEKLTPECKEMQ